MEAPEKLKFVAEIKEVKARKIITNDVIYRLVLESSDPTLHSLGFLNAETLVNVTVEVDNG